MCCLFIKLPKLTDECGVRDRDIEGGITSSASSSRSLPHVSNRLETYYCCPKRKMVFKQVGNRMWESF